MTIIIFKTVVNNDSGTGLPASRGATIWISDGTTNYVCDRGNLPLTGNLQTVLNGQEATIWADMLAGGVLATATENEIATGIQYYIANSGMKVAVFDSTVASLDTGITAICNAITGLNVAQRTGLRQALMASLISVRIETRDRGLV